jgi:hypothetical protein
MRAEVTQISTLTAAVAHVLCFAGLAAAHALALRLLVVFSLSLPSPHLASPPQAFLSFDPN